MVGLIETVRVIDGRAPLWPLHLARATSSALALGITLPPLTAPQGGLDRIVRYEIHEEGVQVSERDVGDSSPVHLVTSPAPHRGYRHKTTDRGWLDAARHGVARAGGDDALILDGQGRVVEGSIWAVGWWDEERLTFPPLDLGGLPSVARYRLDECVRGGIQEMTLFRESMAWRATFVCNAARGIVPVATIDGDEVPDNHRTAALAARFWRRDPA